MMPSLYSGISGLNAHQQRMNVIGNNVANVNTVGYKSSFMTFKEAAIATSRTPGPATPGLQVGLGVNVGGITRRFSSGMLNETGQPSNMAINGNGFFVVKDRGTGANYYTRAGDYVLDLAGTQVNLITPDGYQLVDTTDTVIDLNTALAAAPPLTDGSAVTVASYAVDAQGVITVTGTDGLSYPYSVSTPPAKIALATFQNNNGLKAFGANLYEYTTAAGTNWAAGENKPFAGAVLQGYLESSNVDLAKEFTEMILSQRGFQSNARTVTTSDEILQELMSIKR